MSFDPITAVADLAKTVADKIWADADTKEKAKADQFMAELQGQLTAQAAQVDVDKTEAAHPSVFVAGWRPFVGWVCGSGFAYQFVLRPIVNGVLAAFGVPVVFPGIEVDALNTLLFGMLGLGAARTVEKVKGVARER